MRSKNNKNEIITFKADKALTELLDKIPNRSEFIRNAIMASMDSICPLCGGRGILTPNQKNHWSNFTESHQLQECNDCHEYHLVCLGYGENE
jgi:hypothetical protein